MDASPGMGSEQRLPRLTVGLPVYNGEDYVADAIQSILAQDFDDFVLLVSDNASTDATFEICTRFAEQDPRVVCERWDTNVGAARNFNVLVERARTPLFKWAAHDDVLEPSYLRRCVEALDDDPETVLAHTRTNVIDESGTFKRSYVNRLNEERAYHSPHAARRFGEMIRGVHACFEVFGVIRTDELRRTRLIGPFTSSDRALLAELSLLGRFAEIPEPLFLSRDHSERSIRKHHVDDLSGWFDPDKNERISFPTWRLHVEFGRAILRSSPSLSAGLAASWALAMTMLRRSGALARDVVHATRVVARRRRGNGG